MDDQEPRGDPADATPRSLRLSRLDLRVEHYTQHLLETWAKLGRIVDRERTEFVARILFRLPISIEGVVTDSPVGGESMRELRLTARVAMQDYHCLRMFPVDASWSEDEMRRCILDFWVHIGRKLIFGGGR